MARVYRDQRMNKVISELPGVRDAVYREANSRGSRARAKLGSHRRTGRAEVIVERGRVDSFIILQDENTQAAMSIEFGHTWKGKHVSGLYIITGAAGLA